MDNQNYNSNVINPKHRVYDQYGADQGNDPRQTSVEDNDLTLQDPNDTRYRQTADANFGDNTQRPFRSQPQDAMWASDERGQGQVINERDLGGSRIAGQQEFPKNQQQQQALANDYGVTDNQQPFQQQQAADYDVTDDQQPSEQQQALRNDYGIDQQYQNIGLGGINDGSAKNFEQAPDQQSRAQFISTRANDSDNLPQDQSYFGQTRTVDGDPNLANDSGDQSRSRDQINEPVYDTPSDINYDQRQQTLNTDDLGTQDRPVDQYQQNDEFGVNRNVDQTTNNAPPLPPRNQETDGMGGYQDVAQEIDNMRDQNGGYLPGGQETTTQQPDSTIQQPNTTIQQQPDNIGDISAGVSNMNLTPGQQDSSNAPDTTNTGIHHNNDKPSYSEGLTQKLKGTIKYGLGKILGDHYLQSEGEQQKQVGEQRIQEHKEYVEEKHNQQ